MAIKALYKSITRKAENMYDQQSQAPTTHPRPLDDGIKVDAPA